MQSKFVKNDFFSQLCVILFYGVIAISVFSSIASNIVLPAGGDYPYNSMWIAQAGLALAQGQFPIRYAPTIDSNFIYPVFQFYGPLSFTLAGLVALFTKKIFFSYKFVIWLSISLGAFYFYLLVCKQTFSRPIALLTGLVYLFTPYLLINIDARGAFSEAVAQGILPIVLYYSFMVYEEKCLKTIFKSAIAWSALLMTHLITFAYTSLLMVLFFMLSTLITRKWIEGIRFLTAYIYGCILTSWFLVPIILMSPLLRIAHFGSPSGFNCITPLAGLLSLSATSPVPLPDSCLSTNFLFPAIGLPVMGGVWICLYRLIQKDKNDFSDNNIWFILLPLFGLSLFMVWSPFDFWKYLPEFFSIAQFSYRLMAQVAWIGALLFAHALSWLFKNQLDARHVFVGGILILTTCSSWIPTQNSGGLENYEAVKNPTFSSINYMVGDYSVKLKTQEQVLAGALTYPLIKCDAKKSTILCTLNATQHNEIIALPVGYYPNMVSVRLNGKNVTYYPVYDEKLSNTLAAVKLEPGSYKAEIDFTGIRWANYLSIFAWLLIFTVYLKEIIKVRL